MEKKEIMELNKYFEQAYFQVEKIRSFNEEYSLFIEEEYENCNLFFLKSYLEMFKSEVNNECIDKQLEKLKLLWVYAEKVFEEYRTSELK